MLADLKYLLCVCLFAVLAACGCRGKLYVDELRCCNLKDPEGIDSPVLSWEIKAAAEGVYQKAWEIEIATSEEQLLSGHADVWKSGIQLSDKQSGIAPQVPAFSESAGYFWRVRITDNHSNVSGWSTPAYFSIGLLNEESWKAKWITFNYKKDGALPCFRKEFSAGKDGTLPEKALVYLCGLGCSELYLNGQLVDSTRFLDPAQTNYGKYALYSTFDVANLLKEGNCLGVMLGNGWFSQDKGWCGAPFSYGNPMFRLQLVMIYPDGSRVVLGSDESWTWAEGPVCKTNIYMGEEYDARREIDGWSEPSTSFADWKNASVSTENLPPRLIPQLINPIRKKEIQAARKIWKNSEGNWIFDFGANRAGIPFLSVSQPAGTHLSIRFSEEIDKKGNLDFESTGWIFHGGIFKDEYICKGGAKEEWSPRFTYHGFRYAELSGIEGTPDSTTLKMVVVHSDVEETGAFECSDDQINKLHELCLRTVKSNLHGIPTDCPAREKCGWLGDVHAYVKMANLNFQMNNFWQKYLADIRSGSSDLAKNTLFHERFNTTFYFTDKAPGIPYMIAPGKRLCGVASPDWGTAVVQLPWWLYVYYGNKQVLEDYYPQMQQWVEHVGSLGQNASRTAKYNKETKYIIYQGLGDWCPPAGDTLNNPPIEFTSTAFHYLDTYIMEQVAKVLGKEGDAKMYAAKKELISREMTAKMYNPQKKTFGSQTADAMALDFGLVPAGDEKAVADAIALDIKENTGGFAHCGIFGLSRIGSMLARNGNVQAAWDIFTRKGENSFEWMWKSANATSLWETLPVNEISRKSAYNSSHNHPMQAGFDVFFYEDIAGIRPDSSGYGFKVIRFEPLFWDYLEWAKATIRSPYGLVSSNWKSGEGQFEWEISIPANSSGLVVLPSGKNITINGKKPDFQKYLRIEEASGAVCYKFPSGHYFIRGTK